MKFYEIPGLNFMSSPSKIMSSLPDLKRSIDSTESLPDSRDLRPILPLLFYEGELLSCYSLNVTFALS